MTAGSKTPNVAKPKERIAIISGPSGAGKSTVVRRLASDCSVPLRVSISATTRKPREGEVNGVNYHFLSKEDFARRQAANEFLEAKEVFGRGEWYGTLKSVVAEGLNAGDWVVLEIDVEGAMSVLETYPDAVTIFVHVGTLEELENRLRGRRTESEEAIQRRLEVARRELTYLPRYQYEVINHTVEQAVADICRILNRLEEV